MNDWTRTEKELLTMVRNERLEQEAKWGEDDHNRTQVMVGGDVPPDQWLWVMLFLTFKVYYSFRRHSLFERVIEIAEDACGAAQSRVYKRNEVETRRPALYNTYRHRLAGLIAAAMSNEVKTRRPALYTFRHRLAGLIAAAMSWDDGMMYAHSHNQDVGLDLPEKIETERDEHETEGDN